MNQPISQYQDIQQYTQQTLVTRYASLVKRIAHHLTARLPKNVMIEDLIQAGMMGLLEAAKNYDASKGAQFETYAGIRIRGTMLDEVRKNDWVPRSVYRNSRMISEAIRQVEHKTGRDAKDSEVAKELGLPLQEYHKMLQDVATSQMYGFEDLGVSDDLMGQGTAAPIEEPLSGLQRDNFRDCIAKAISQLPERERLVLALYYDEELNLKEIGEILQVSESRVCQIHSQAMARLRTRLNDKV